MASGHGPRVTIRQQDIDESQFEIDTGIKIIPGSPQDLCRR